MAAPKERLFGEHPIDLMHQLKRLCVQPNWCVIDRRTADLEQFTLTRQAQLCALFTDRLAAFPLSSILRIDCRAVDGLIALALVIKIISNRELADFGVKFFDLAVLILCLFDIA